MIYQGDCRRILSVIPADYFGSVVTDPPYGLSTEPDMPEVLTHWLAGDDYAGTGGGFMGKTWDSFVPGPATWREVLRVLKPGGYAVAFFGTRTYDLGVTAMRLAGFEIRDQLDWLYGQGFPKSTSVQLEVDKATGKIGHRGAGFSTAGEAGAEEGYGGPGTALKPAHEPIVLARKPLAAVSVEALRDRVGPHWWTHRQVTTEKQRAKESKRLGVGLPGGRLRIATGRPLDRDGRGQIIVVDEAGAVVATLPGPAYSDKPIRTLAANHLVYGTGGLDIDGCRIGASGGTRGAGVGEVAGVSLAGSVDGTLNGPRGVPVDGLGRWPANVILDEEAGEILDGQSGYQKTGTAVRRNGPTSGGITSINRPKPQGPDVPAREEGGGASRFFYCPKASRAERERGLDDLPIQGTQATVGREEGSAGTGNPRAGAGRSGGRRNTHPTVKPLDLMRWLVRLVTPPGGVILDPFAGSGSTGIAAVLEGKEFLGIELEPHSVEIARRRIGWHSQRSETK